MVYVLLTLYDKLRIFETSIHRLLYNIQNEISNHGNRNNTIVTYFHYNLQQTFNPHISQNSKGSTPYFSNNFNQICLHYAIYK
jgi:hypothetical protein